MKIHTFLAAALLLPALAVPDEARTATNWKTWSPSGSISKKLVALSSDSFKEYVHGFQADYDGLPQFNGDGLSGLKYARETAYVGNESAFDWMQRNIPYFDCPDDAFREIYYFRHWMNRLHLKNNGAHFVVSEFIGRAPWADTNNVIVCPAGHQLSWLTWLDEPEYARSYVNYFLYAKEALPRQFRQWLAWNAYQTQQVHPSPDFARNVLDGLKKIFEKYRDAKVPDFHDLYGCNDWHDGFERQIGGGGVRVTLNSYMYASARAIASLAKQAGETETQATYSQIAETIKADVQAHLWDDKDKFFKTYKNQAWLDWDVRTYGKESWFVSQAVDRLVDVREITGYIPWQFNLPGDTPEFAAAWRFIKDRSSGFAGQNGLAGAQKDHPRYNIPVTNGARWNGLSWFFAETQALTALANLLNDYHQQFADKNDYFEELQRYTKRGHYTVYSQGKSLRPWATEWVDPDKSKANGCPESSGILYYFHSGYTELIINGLIGIRPQEDDSLTVNPLVPDRIWSYFCLDGLRYKGHYICVLWDADGSHYNKGKGLSVFVDGVKKDSRDDLGKLSIRLFPSHE